MPFCQLPAISDRPKLEKAVDGIRSTGARYPKRGLLGFLVGRSKSELDEDRAYRRLVKDEIVLVLTDDDLIEMLIRLEDGEDPTAHIRGMYNRFLQRM